MASLRYYLDRPLKDQAEHTLYLRYKTAGPAAGGVALYPAAAGHARQQVLPARWDGRAQRLRGTSLVVLQRNQQLVAFVQHVQALVNTLRARDPARADPSPQAVRRAVLGQPDTTTGKTTPRAGAVGQDAVALPAPTLPALVRRMCQLRAGELRIGTRTLYEHTARCLEKFAPAGNADWALPALAQEHLETWRAWLVESNEDEGNNAGDAASLAGRLRGNKRANDHLAVVATTLNYFRGLSAYKPLIGADLLDTLKRPYRVTSKVRQHLSEAEMLLVCHAPLPPRARGTLHLLRDLYCFSWLTSLRQSDVLALGPEHVVWKTDGPDGPDGPDNTDNTDNTRCPVALNTTSIKSTSLTSVPVNALAARILLRWLARDVVLKSPLDHPRRNVLRYAWPAHKIFPQLPGWRSEMLHQLWRALGLFTEPVEVVRLRGAVSERTVVPRYQLLTLHTARHGFGNFMAESDVSLADTQLLMGHADSKTTSIYFHRPERLAFDKARHALEHVGQSQEIREKKL